MPTIDWPEALIPQTAQLTLRKAGAQFASPFNGTLQAVDFVGERWTLSASLAQMSARNPRGVGAFCNVLAGGVERVRVWPFHTGGVPRGSMRGAPVLGATATRGQTSLAISAATAGANMLLGSSFEFDSNSDGLADNWNPYSIGAASGVARSRVEGLRGLWGQRVSATSLGSADTDRIGFGYYVPLSAAGGAAYSVSANVRAGAGQIVFNLDFNNALGAYIGSANQQFAATTDWLQRRAMTVQAPPNAASMSLTVWLQGAGAVIPGAWVEFDNVQVERGAATEYAFLPTVFAGDFLAAGGQLFQVAADTTLSDLGAGSVPIVNRVRSTIASGSAVTWYRPTCEMVLPAMQAGPVHRPGVIESTALDLVEVW